MLLFSRGQGATNLARDLGRESAESAAETEGCKKQSSDTPLCTKSPEVSGIKLRGKEKKH